MAFLEDLLAKVGYVKLSRYGLALTPQGRVLSLQPPVPTEGSSARVVGWREENPPTGEFAIDPPLPPMAPPPAPAMAPVLATPGPRPPAVPPPLPPRKVAAKPAPQPDEEAEWQAAVAAAKAKADQEDEEWEWQLAMARAKAAAEESENRAALSSFKPMASKPAPAPAVIGVLGPAAPKPAPVRPSVAAAMRPSSGASTWKPPVPPTRRTAPIAKPAPAPAPRLARGTGPVDRREPTPVSMPIVAPANDDVTQVDRLPAPPAGPRPSALPRLTARRS